MTLQRIVVLDPGRTTGVIDCRLDQGDRPIIMAMEMQFKDLAVWLMSVADYAHRLAVDTVIIAESFIIGPQTAKNTQAPWSLEVIGVARMVSEVYCGKPLRLQQPSAAKRFSSDARLHRMGWHTPGKGHANDAARHLLLYMATHGLLEDSLLSEFAEMP